MTKLRHLLDAYVFDDEGEEYEERATEPGGAVKLGVSMEALVAYHKLKKLPAPTFATLRALTRDGAADVYDLLYWRPMRGEEMPEGVSYAVFDPVMNSGLSAGGKMLQLALGFSPEADWQQLGFAIPKSAYADQPAQGRIGSQTLAAIAQCANLPGLVDEICDVRLRYMQTRPGWPKFRRGWIARVRRVRIRAKSLLTPQGSAR